MTGPSGGAFFHDMEERVIIWQDSDDAKTAAANLQHQVTLAVNMPTEATELPVQAVADAHVIDGAHAAGDGIAHGIADVAQSHVVIDAHHDDAGLVSGDGGHAGDVALSHDDPSAASGA